jgi:hypothetical protein
MEVFVRKVLIAAILFNALAGGITKIV